MSTAVDSGLAAGVQEAEAVAASPAPVVIVETTRGRRAVERLRRAAPFVVVPVVLAASVAAVAVTRRRRAAREDAAGGPGAAPRVDWRFTFASGNRVVLQPSLVRGAHLRGLVACAPGLRRRGARRR